MSVCGRSFAPCVWSFVCLFAFSLCRRALVPTVEFRPIRLRVAMLSLFTTQRIQAHSVPDVEGQIVSWIVVQPLQRQAETQSEHFHLTEALLFSCFVDREGVSASDCGRIHFISSRQRDGWPLCRSASSLRASGVVSGTRSDLAAQAQSGRPDASPHRTTRHGPVDSRCAPRSCTPAQGGLFRAQQRFLKL